MKLDPQSLAYIQNVVETAALVKIHDISIEPAKLRGADADRTVLLFQEHSIPAYLQQALSSRILGLNRTDVFMSRWDLARVCDNPEIEVVLDDKQEFVRALVMKGKGAKIDYRAANPATIAAPKTFNDKVAHKVRVNPEAILLLQKGASAMKTDEVTLVGDKEGITFEMTEGATKDTFTYKFAERADIESEVGTTLNFTYTYLIKNLLILLKQNPDGYCYITTKGLIKFVVNGLDLYIPYKV